MELTDEEILNLRKIANKGNGDCLFLAVGQSLRHLNWEEEYCRVETLRLLVSEHVTQDQFETLTVIYNDALKERDTGLILDYDFMNFATSLNILKEIIKTPHYLGDEIAIDILESQLRINIHIIEYNGQSFNYKRRFNDAKKFYYNIILSQDVRSRPPHYELLSYKKKRILQKNELPLCVQKSVLNDFKKVM